MLNDARIARVLFRAAGLAASTGVVAVALTRPALAGPLGARVVQGNVTIAQNGPNTVIHASNGSIINYNSFNLASHESVRFIQPSANATVLNRITGMLPTTINGTIIANGRVFFINPAGIMFGPGAIINVGSMIAGAANISNADFTRGNYQFTSGPGSVVNHGTITGTNIALVGSQVANFGSIVATDGSVVMAAGDRVYLGERNSRLFARVQPGTTDRMATPGSVGVHNAGTISAPRGSVQMVAGDIYATAVWNQGTVTANQVTAQAERVGGSTGSGAVVISGLIDASNSLGRGGSVTITGESVSLIGAQVDVSGLTAGGVVRIGGDYQGGGTLAHADSVLVDAGSVIRADATGRGDGGRIIAWGDNSLRFFGSAYARGGSRGGSGGLIETSTHGVGQIDPLAISASALSPTGRAGQWLIDPLNVDITTVTANGGFTGGQYDPTATGATVNVTDIRDTLQGGTDVVITTSFPAGTVVTGEAGNITWASGNDLNVTLGSAQSLTLRAANDITVGSNITATGAPLSLTLTALDPGQAAEPNAGTSGAIAITGLFDLNGGSFTASGASFTNSAAAMSNVSSYTLNFTGDATLETSGPTVIDGATTVGNDFTILANSGDITFNTLNVTRDLSATATAGNILGGGPGTITVGRDASFTTSGSGNTIDLSTGGINIAVSGTTSVSTNGAGANASLASVLDLSLNNVTTGGDFTVNSSGGIARAAGGSLTVAGNGSFTSTGTDAHVDLSVSSGSTTDITGTIAVNTVGTAGDAIVHNLGDINFAASSVGGSLTARSTNGTISNAAGSVNVGGDATLITDAGAGGDITVGAAQGWSVAGEHRLTTAGGNVTINTTDVVTLGESAIIGDLSVTTTAANGAATAGAPAGAIRNSIGTGVISVSGTTTLDTSGGTGDINIAAAAPGNSFRPMSSVGAVTLSTSSTATATFTNDVALALDNFTGGNLVLQANTGAITIANPINVPGTATFTQLLGNLSLDPSLLSVDGALSLNTGAGDVTVTNNAANTILGPSNVHGNLNLTAANGNLTDAASGTASIHITGNASLNASGSATSSITLRDLDVAGTFTLNTGSGTSAGANIHNTTGITLLSSTVGGNLTLTTDTGDINILAPETITVGGSLVTLNTSAGGNITVDSALTLTDAAARIALNTAGGTGGTGAATITQGSVRLGNSTLTGPLTVTATTGGITSAGSTLTLTGGDASFTAQTADQTIVLDTISLTGGRLLLSTAAGGNAGNVFVNSSSALALGPSTINGHLTVQSSGNVTGLLADAVTVTQSAAFITTGTGTTLTLPNLAVTGPIALNTSGDTTFTNATAIVLNSNANTVGPAAITNSAVGGNLNITATTGNISNTHAVTISGAGVSTFTADAGDIVFTNTGATALALTNPAAAFSFHTTGAGNDVSLTHATRVNLADCDVGGLLTVIATTGGITNIGFGDVTAAGGASFTTSAAASSITLGDATDTFALTGGQLVLATNLDAGSNATINSNNTALTLGSAAIGHDLTVDTGTAVLTIAGDQRVGNFTGAGNQTTPGAISYTASTIELGANVTSNRGDITFNGVTALNLASPVVSSRYTGATAVFTDSPRGTITFTGNITTGGTDNTRSLTILSPNGSQIDSTSTTIPVIRFGGTQIGLAGSRLANLFLNNDNVRISSPRVASIVSDNPGGLVIRAANQLVIGRREKFTVSGSGGLTMTVNGLVVPAGQAAIRMGDLTVLGEAVITAPSLQLVRRQSGSVATNLGGLVNDKGVDWVIGGPLTLNVASISSLVLSGDTTATHSAVIAASGSHASNSTVTFVPRVPVTATLINIGGRAGDLAAFPPAPVSFNTVPTASLPGEVEGSLGGYFYPTHTPVVEDDRWNKSLFFKDNDQGEKSDKNQKSEPASR